MVTKKEAKLRAKRLAEVLKCPHLEVTFEKKSYRKYQMIREIIGKFKIILWPNVSFGIEIKMKVSQIKSFADLLS